MGLPPRVLIVGAGFGGLSAALDLAKHGIDVVVLEADAVPGGKARSVQLGSRHIDVGPTVLTMKWVWTALGADAFEDLFEPVDILARHAFADGSVLDLFADRRRSRDAIEAFAGADEAQRFLAFSEQAERIWETARGPFVLSQRPSIIDVARHTARHGLGAMLRIDAHRTMSKAIDGAFRDPRLRQLFGRYATYCGGSPYETPATYNLVAHVESAGIHRVKGGISALASAMATRAAAMGASFRYRADVQGLIMRGNRVIGVRLASGEELVADAVVWNGDISHLASLGVPKVPPTPREGRSLSAFTIALAGRPKGFALASHNVFFAESPEQEWRELAHAVASDPTVYVFTPDEETFLLVVNAPPNGDVPGQWTENEKNRCRNAALSTLARAGLSIDSTHQSTTTPADFAKRFPSTGGALYGAKPRGMTASLSRAASRGPLRGLYLAGGSVHPGPGVPMATLSGLFASESIRADLGSTGPSRTAATSGTTSTA